VEFANEVKGSVTHAAIACMLRHAGYPVVQTGVEVTIPALPLLTAADVASLELGPELRSAPDLCVLPRGGAALHVEVKYRKRLDRNVLRLLAEKLADQQRHYPQTHTILVRSVSPQGDAARADDLVRVLPPGRLQVLAAADLFYHTVAGEGISEELRLEPLWQALRPVTSVFDRLQGEKREILERLVPLIRALADL
jgi:hypothetical protein